MKTTQTFIPTVKQRQILTVKQSQDLKVLSFSNDELQRYIQNELESNPLLEQDSMYEIGYSSKHADNYELMLNYIVKEETLSEVVQEQIHLYQKPIHEDLALFLADLLDDHGYLPFANKDIQRYFPQYSLDDIEDTIQILQGFEPYGIAARNVQECLLIQLSQMQDVNTHIAIEIVNEYLEELANHQLDTIMEKLEIDADCLHQAMEIIHSLQPKPGSIYASTSMYLNPDVYVGFEDGEFTIELYKSNYGLRINEFEMEGYLEEALAYIKQEKQKAERLLTSIQKRNDTLLHVTQSIISHQLPYFKEGKPLQTLTLKMVAEDLSCNESTISRCISNKSMIFDHQTIPLKYFFVHAVADTSVTVVYDALKTLVKEEDKKKPLSDQKLSDLLKEKGYDVSRRTIAKYRTQLSIPPASKRKSI